LELSAAPQPYLSPRAGREPAPRLDRGVDARSAAGETLRDSRIETPAVRETDAEGLLWQHVRNRQLHGHKLVRQEPIGPYICDFVCRDRHLIVEADGGQHADSLADARRDQWLAAHGYRVLRFWNNDILTNLDGVLETIAAALEKCMAPRLRRAPLTPTLSPHAGRGSPAASSERPSTNSRDRPHIA